MQKYKNNEYKIKFQCGTPGFVAPEVANITIENKD